MTGSLARPAAARPSSSHPLVTFSALSLIFFVISAGAFSSLGVVLPHMVRELHWDWREAGFGYTLLGLSCGLASFLPAILIRRIGVRGAMLMGMATMIAGFAALAVTQTVWLFLLATVLVGLSFAVVGTVPGAHVLTDLFENRSTALGAYFTIGALGGVAGPLLFNAINEATHGWRAYWWAFVGLSLASGLFAALSAPPRRDETGRRVEAPEQISPGEVIEGLKAWTVRRALATPQFYVIVGGYTTYLLINTTAHGFAVEHLIERGVKARSAAVMLSLEALFGAAVSVVGGVVGERVSPKLLMTASLTALVLGMTALAFARGWGLMSLYIVGVGIGFGLSFIASTMLLLSYFGTRPNLELYSIMSFLSTSAAIGPAVGGWARDVMGGFTDMFLLCSAVTLAMLLATLALSPPRPARSAAVKAPGRPA